MAFNFQQDIDLEESDSESRAGAGAEEDFLPKMRPEENGMSFYLLQPGMKIYRGSGTFTMSSPFRKGSPYFFTTTIDGARKYGAVFEFTIPEGVEYRLVAMDDENTIEALKRQAAGNQRISLLLEHNYTIGRRNSSTETDKEVGSYLCAQGYNGYGAGKISINTETGEILHNEIVLCDPSALIRRQITTDPTELATINQEYSAHKAAEDLRKQRLEKKKASKGRPRYTDEEEYASTGLGLGAGLEPIDFGADAYNSPYNTPSKKPAIVTNLFSTPGGGKRKSRRSVKRRRNKTSKKRKSLRRKVVLKRRRTNKRRT